jgi:hypothetical protein
MMSIVEVMIENEIRYRGINHRRMALLSGIPVFRFKQILNDGTLLIASEVQALSRVFGITFSEMLTCMKMDLNDLEDSGEYGDGNDDYDCYGGDNGDDDDDDDLTCRPDCAICRARDDNPTVVSPIVASVKNEYLSEFVGEEYDFYTIATTAAEGHVFYEDDDYYEEENPA